MSNSHTTPPRKPDLPAAKRAGLHVDLARLARDGDAWLTPEDRYALKTYGVCAQLQPNVFMVRVRVPGGRLASVAARGLADLARTHGRRWIHLTTRQNVELHWVADRAVPAVLDAVTALGLSTRSSCGHTLRNVVCAEDAGLGLDEPFDCAADVRAVSEAIVARSAELNCVLPSRVNLVFGGSPRARHDALVNDGGFVSTIRDGEPGYEVWGGGSLGRAPRLSVRLADFVSRVDVLAAAEALVEVFVEHGEFENPARGRMKHVVEALGEETFVATWTDAFGETRCQARYAPSPVDLLPEPDRAAILEVLPMGGWSDGVRPTRAPGTAIVTVSARMGDLDADQLELLADVADDHTDGAMVLGRDQEVVLPGVAIGEVARVRGSLQAVGLALRGELPVVRACTGSAVCALGITTAPDAGNALVEVAALARNSSLRIHVSGCPNACAQHQVADVGLAGSKVKVGGRVRDGYLVYVGADLDAGLLGEVVGRAAAEDVAAVVAVTVGVWEALRHGAEPIGRTARRVGLDAFGASVKAVLRERWETGADDASDPAHVPTAPAASSTAPATARAPVPARVGSLLLA